MGHKGFPKSTSDGKIYSNPTPSLILIMSTSTSAPSNVQLTPEAQAFFEHILDQKLKEVTNKTLESKQFTERISLYFHKFHYYSLKININEIQREKQYISTLFYLNQL